MDWNLALNTVAQLTLCGGFVLMAFQLRKLRQQILMLEAVTLRYLNITPGTYEFEPYGEDGALVLRRKKVSPFTNDRDVLVMKQHGL